MKYIHPFFPRLLVCVGLITACSITQLHACHAQDTKLAKRVKLGLINSEGMRKDWPMEDANEKSALSTTEVIVKDGDTIHSLLSANKIHPDVEAFGLVYELNPNLTSLKELTISTKIVLPVVQAGPKAKPMFEAGYFALLTVDPLLKEMFNGNARALYILQSKVATLSPERFAKGVQRDAVLKSIINITDTLEFIRVHLLRRNGRPLTTETLDQLNGEAVILRSILDPLTNSEQELDKEAVAQITDIEKDILIKQTRFIEVAAGAPADAWPTVKVIVKTRKAGQSVSGFRIYYVPVALQKKPDRVRAFTTLSTPTDWSLPEADYIIWAGKDGDPTHSHWSADIPTVEVRSNGQSIPVELTIVK